MAAPPFVVDEHAVLHSPLDGLLRRLHYLWSTGGTPVRPTPTPGWSSLLSGVDGLRRVLSSPGRQRQNLAGLSVTSRSLLASTSGPSSSTGLGEEHSTLWTRWYIRLTPSESNRQNNEEIEARDEN